MDRFSFYRLSVICAVALVLGSCNAPSSTSSPSSGSASRAIDANTTWLKNVDTDFDGTAATCAQVSRDTSSCQSAREALGLSGNWLSFSCNVVIGLANASKQVVTTWADATYVTLTTTDLPDYTSTYWPTTGSYSFTAYEKTVSGTFSSLYVYFKTAFNNPNKIGSHSAVLYIPKTPTAATPKSQQMGMGTVGLAVNGVYIYNSVAGNTDNIFSEGGSFDQCGGHPDQSSSYHYHTEPYSISYDDNKLIGVMLDGFFVYGRRDYNNTTPGSVSAIGTDSAGDLYVYGGHTGVDPVSGTGSDFHYHLTEWKGCYDENGGTKYADNGQTDDGINTPSGSCTTGAKAYWVDAWFLSGHGNGGVYNTIPGTAGTQNPAQTETAERYYYGTPGSCTNCP